MPLYFFDTDNGNMALRDDIGSELKDDRAACNEGTWALAEMAKDFLPGSGPQKNIVMSVRDSQGRALMQLSLRFAVTPLS